MVISTIMMLNIIHRQTIPSTGHVNWLQNHKLIITVATCGLVLSHLIGYFRAIQQHSINISGVYHCPGLAVSSQMVESVLYQC